MLLSKLVYLIVKNAIYYADSNFTYDAFANGDFDNDDDYALNINNAFGPLNEAIARLSDLDKIPHQIASISTVESGYVAPIPENAKEIVSVADHNRKPIDFKPYGMASIILARPCGFVYIEYKLDMPYFEKENLKSSELDEELKYVDSNISLKQYGITDSMCNFIIEYAQGRLLEPIAPELANMHLTRAETYFSNIRSVDTAFRQTSIETTMSIDCEPGLNVLEINEDLAHDNMALNREIERLKGE